jgi:hypothetical protein
MEKLRAAATSVFLWGVPLSARACAVCFGRDSGSPGLARGFFWGVLLLLALPMGLVLAIGGRIFFAVRRQNTLRQAPGKVEF